MQVYLVGGAVRDRLLGLPVRERDYVVVGARVDEMLARGFRQVGRDFPVFLHPQTHEEYALARTRRRMQRDESSPRPHADPAVSIEEDLARRDLTINAMAEAPDGTLIDPFDGHRDLEQRLLRHVSPAFAEDPVRVLRLARFMARYHPLGFRIAPDTLALIRQMAVAGALRELVPERVWQELYGALTSERPEVFFEALRSCGALAQIFPEIDRLWGVPQPKAWHPEIDCGVHTLMTLRIACSLSAAPEVRFAALTHDLGKGATPAEILPSHHGHEARGAELVRRLCERLRTPKRFRILAERCAVYHGYCHRLRELKPVTILKVLEALDAFRHPDRFAQYLLVCEADYRGRKGFDGRAYHQARRFWQLFESARGVDTQGLRGMPPGRAAAAAMRELRLQALRG